MFHRIHWIWVLACCSEHGKNHVMTFMTNCQESDVKMSRASSEPEVEEVIDMDMVSMFFSGKVARIIKYILFAHII